MLFQPFVENAIIHGIHKKTEGRGFILIKFEKDGDYLLGIIEDNGVGLQKSVAVSTHQREKSHVTNRDVVFAFPLGDFINGDYTGMIQGRCRSGFTQESRPAIAREFPVRLQEFQHDGPVQARVAGLVDLAHAAAAQAL